MASVSVICYSESGLLDGDADGLGDACTVLGVDLVEVGKDALLDVAAALAQSTRDVGDDLCSHCIVEDIAEEGAGLLVVGVGVLVGVTASLANHRLLCPGVDRGLDGSAGDGVGLVVGLGAITAIYGHETITGVVVAHASAVGAVDGDLVVVGAKSVPVGVRVVDEASLEHLVVGGLNTWDHVGGGEGSLLRLGVVVLRVLVEDELADALERIIGVRPDLGDVIDVEAVVLGVSDGHDLGVPSPRWEVTLGNSVMEVHGSIVLVGLALFSSGFGSEGLDTLVRLVVVFHEELLILGVDPLEGVGAVAVHLTIAIGSTAVRHEDGHLVESLGGIAPEIPSHVGVLNTGLRMSFLTVDEIWELNGIFNEKDGCVVSNHVVVAFLSVMLDGEATGVAIAVVGAALTSDGRETKEDRCSLANGVHEGGLAETIAHNRQLHYEKVYKDTYGVISSVIST